MPRTLIFSAGYVSVAVAVAALAFSGSEGATTAAGFVGIVGFIAISVAVAHD